MFSCFLLSPRRVPWRVPGVFLVAFLGVFLGAPGIAIFGTTVAISLCGIVASRQLHRELLNNVLHSPMSFFETTPSGNLLNRFAKEIDGIDCMIPDGLRMMLGYVFKLLEVCVIVMMATPFAAVFILPLAFLYAFVQVRPGPRCS